MKGEKGEGWGGGAGSLPTSGFIQLSCPPDILQDAGCSGLTATKEVVMASVKLVRRQKKKKLASTKRGRVRKNNPRQAPDKTIFFF